MNCPYSKFLLVIRLCLVTHITLALPRSFPSPENEFYIIYQSRFQHKLDRLIDEPQSEFRYVRNNW